MLHHMSIREKILVMIAVMSGLFLAALDQSIVSTALPTIVRDFNGLDELSWVVTAYLLTSTITIPIAGKLSDIFGRRKVLLTGITIFVLGSMLTGLSWNMGSLIGFRAIQGIGGGVLMSSAFAVIGDLFVPAERGRWQGLFGAVFGLSSVIGPLLGGLLTDHASWRWCFYINVPVGIVAFSLILRYLPTILAKNVKKGIDYVGAMLLSGGLGSFLLGVTWGGNEYPWGSWQIIGLLTAAVALIGTFIWHESRTDDPIMPLDIFKNGIFRVSAVMLFLVGIAMFGAIVYLPLFAQAVQGSSATNSGIILLPLVLSLTVTSLVSGQITSRTGKYKKLAVFGTFTTTAALFWLSTLTPTSTHTDLVLRMIPLGVGIGIMMPLFNLVVQNAFPQKMLGVVSSSVQLFRGIGSTVGVALMGTLMNHTLSNKVASLPQNNFTDQLSKQHEKLDANTLQQILSSDGQASVLSQISKLPEAAQSAMTTAFHSFVHAGQQALSTAITHVFFAGGVVLLSACILVFFLKEIPLRKSMEADHGPV